MFAAGIFMYVCLYVSMSVCVCAQCTVCPVGVGDEGDPHQLINSIEKYKTSSV